jgi:hypothetical protein
MNALRKLAITAAISLAVAGGSAIADGPNIAADKVEEDWQLVIATPDVDGVGPQITTVMSPTSDGSSPFVAYDMNYQEYPSFVAGGMQLQVWSGSNVLATASQGSAQFNTPNETITWTQRMHVDDGSIVYKIINGNSTTWGAFGSDENPIRVSFNSQITSLVGYDPAYSVAKSGVTWESNYVTSMKLVQVRYYSNGVLIQTDSTPRQINLGN